MGCSFILKVVAGLWVAGLGGQVSRQEEQRLQAGWGSGRRGRQELNYPAALELVEQEVGLITGRADGFQVSSLEQEAGLSPSQGGGAVKDGAAAPHP